MESFLRRRIYTVRSSYGILTGPTNTLLKTFRADRSIRVLAFSPDGRLLACSSPDTIWIWNTVTYALHLIPESLRDIMALSFSPDIRILASSSTSQTFTFDVDLWDATTGVLLRTFESRSSPIKAWKFSPDGRLLASVSTDHQIRLSDVAGVGKNQSGGVETSVLFSNRRLFDADILKIAWDLSDVSSKRKLFLAFSAIPRS